PVHDVPAHVARLLREKLLTDEDRLVEVPELAVLVRQWREVPSRILVEFLPEFVDAGRTGHLAPAEGSTLERKDGENTLRRWNKSIRKCITHLILRRSWLYFLQLVPTLFSLRVRSYALCCIR